MASEIKDDAPPKKRWEKPRLSRVALRPEEAVLGFCKNGNRSGPLHVKCTNAGGCSTTGS
jgi:hypothetical protein